MPRRDRVLHAVMLSLGTALGLWGGMVVPEMFRRGPVPVPTRRLLEHPGLAAFDRELDERYPLVSRRGESP